MNTILSTIVADARELPWRVGRKVGRTVYVQVQKHPTNEDELIGVMDTRELATEVVRAHNARLYADARD